MSLCCVSTILFCFPVSLLLFFLSFLFFFSVICYFLSVLLNVYARLRASFAYIHAHLSHCFFNLLLDFLTFLVHCQLLFSCQKCWLNLVLRGRWLHLRKGPEGAGFSFSRSIIWSGNQPICSKIFRHFLNNIGKVLKLILIER